MDLAIMNRGKSNILWKKPPEQYLIQPMDYCAMLIFWFLYMSFGLQIFMCQLSHCQYLMTALDYSEMKSSSTVLSSCDCS
jgi:hypothetical protein